MATRRSLEVITYLRSKGWKTVPLPQQYCGDPRVIDPITGDKLGIYEAEQLQLKRDANEEHS